jgi:hypothetical protein
MFNKLLHIHRDFQVMCFALPKVNETYEYLKELLKYHGKLEILENFKDWKIPTFPIKAMQLAEHEVQLGQQTGFVLTKLKKIWIDREFQLELNEVGEYIPEIMKDWEQVAGDYVKHSAKKRKMK